MIAKAVRRAKGVVPEVTTMELFFDLVYVFAVSQLALLLVHHLTLEGAVQTLVLFGAVWWVWNYTTWATNWIDPDRLPVRVLMVVLMGLSLIMSAAIPEAFGERGMQFAVAVVLIQLIRPLFMIVALRGDQIGRNYVNLFVWSAGAGVLWIAGAFLDGHARLIVWALALAVDVMAPEVNLWVPGLGSTPMSTWRLEPEHLVERNRLIFIIALGETVLSLGREFSETETTAIAYVSLIVGFALTVSFWWLYFARHSGEAEERLKDADDRTTLARGGYAYAHAVLVGGIIVSAVGAELMMAHPREHAELATALAIAGGPAIFMIGITLFVRATGGVDRFEGVAGAAGILALVVVVVIGATAGLSLLLVSALTVVIMYALVGAAALHARGSAPAAAVR
ncbi:low temperature requirement protein A [Gordonia sp. CPCC 205515]|uniref:low temperature requirement protein A n=1 Tax=Gordonia sp. CPCC 205515 TaxID=3140791 RepID=UPI003AF365A7